MWTALQHTAALPEQRLVRKHDLLAAVCQPQFRGKALRLHLHYEYFLRELPAIFPEALQLTEQVNY